jgi:hypothetical protein
MLAGHYQQEQQEALTMMIQLVLATLFSHIMGIISDEVAPYQTRKLPLRMKASWIVTKMIDI